MKTKQKPKVNWLAWASAAYCVLALTCVFMSPSGRSPIIRGLRRDIIILSVLGHVCSIGANWLPSDTKARCGLIHLARILFKRRTHFRQSGFHFTANIYNWTLHKVVKLIKPMLTAYDFVIDWVCLIGARWGRNHASLN